MNIFKLFLFMTQSPEVCKVVQKLLWQSSNERKSQKLLCLQLWDFGKKWWSVYTIKKQFQIKEWGRSRREGLHLKVHQLGQVELLSSLKQIVIKKKHEDNYDPDQIKLKYAGDTSSRNLLRSNIMTHMVPEVVGTMGMSSASVGIDQGIWNWGASSRITMFL